MDKLREDIFEILFPSADVKRAADWVMIEKIIARVRAEDKKLDAETTNETSTGWWSRTA